MQFGVVNCWRSRPGCCVDYAFDRPAGADGLRIWGGRAIRLLLAQIAARRIAPWRMAAKGQPRSMCPDDGGPRLDRRDDGDARRTHEHGGDEPGDIAAFDAGNSHHHVDREPPGAIAARDAD